MPVGVSGKSLRHPAKVEDLTDAVKHTYDELGIPEVERRYLSGGTAQAEAWKLGWKSFDETDYCPDCW
jgi:Fe-S cluster assembly scaffold protein SufB